jgi:carotenoid cleavage dioxygenase-like enzyme
MGEASRTATEFQYTTGFTSLDAEIDVPRLPISGALPGWLSGELVRNGPAKFESGGQSFRHWFDGQAMLHRFAFADGVVGYRNRFLDTPGSRSVRHKGRIDYGEFATDPCRSIFARLFTQFRRPASPNASINVVPMNGGQVAVTETTMAVQFDPETLATLGITGYADQVGGQLSTAHPHQEPRSGDLVNYALAFSRRSEYRVYRQPKDGLSRELIAAFPTDKPGYVHSFGITEDYVVLAVFPFVVNPLSLLLSGKPFIENYRWRPELGTRFVVIGLADGAVRGVYRTEAFFAFHHINAYMDSGELVVDACSYPDASVIDALYLNRLRDGDSVPIPVPTRYRIDLDRGTVRSNRIADIPLELPRIAYGQYNGRGYRFAYGVSADEVDSRDWFNRLVKVDVDTGQSSDWFEPGCYPGEPVFVPAPDPAAEDDGVVLSVVLDVTHDRSFMLVLDATSFTELARAAVPHAIPFGFHGQFTRR